MGQSLAQVYLHLIFSTKDRRPYIDDKIEKDLFSYIGGIIKHQDGIPLCINGTSNHIHILYSHPRTKSLFDFVKEIKGSSSKWVKMKGSDYKTFGWQDGYAAFSVSSSKKEIVEKYIMNQKGHHKKEEFREELLSFLDKYNLEYDETYLWR
ncbi:IS200/IS605 family transposase [Bacteroidales bacterium OttesenSCG-928-J19]|nr:IS200/IS605 family transposase [Bacteroidales bacterium OttesenSCG-928-J19]